MNLSQSVEDYVKAIFVCSRGDSASTTDIAERLGVSPASVTGMLKKLKGLKLVEYESYKGVRLTHAGRKVALEIIRHHRLIETYLAQALGYEWDEVHDEAERLEHHISEEFEDRIAAILGDPKYDPHGDPIPTKDGKLPPVSRERLADADVGEAVTVSRVTAHDKPTLRFLRENGIGIGTKLRIAKRDDDAGHITVKRDRTSIELSESLCRTIFIER